MLTVTHYGSCENGSRGRTLRRQKSVHVVNRTVRRCFLLGDNPVSGQNYDDRKVWSDKKLVHLW